MGILEKGIAMNLLGILALDALTLLSPSIVPQGSNVLKTNWKPETLGHGVPLEPDTKENALVMETNTTQRPSEGAGADKSHSWVPKGSPCPSKCWYNPHPKRKKCMMRRAHGRGPCKM